ncbi:hypothetical protein IV102_28510 [bacterium]|nr:hypothetical protein [bacterium]
MREIQTLIDEFRTRRWASNPYELTCRLLDGPADRVVTLVDMVLEQSVEPAGEFLWGSGGIGYGQWCDTCKVSGYFWQCT